MARYIIQDEQTKGIKKALPKFGTLHVNGEKIQGGVRVIGYRKYAWGEQVDVEFIGKIYARVKWGKMEWFDSSIMNNEDVKVSKVRVNRLIRRCLLNDVKHRLNYFGVNINEISQITKLKWL